MKKKILAKEEEIQSMAKKLNVIADRLDRVLSMLYAGSESVEMSNTPKSSASGMLSETSIKGQGPAKSSTPKYSKFLSQMR